jgi:hypothetical protein
MLVDLPDDWEFVQQNAISAHNMPTSTLSNAFPESPTIPCLAVPGSVISRNPFLSLIRGRKGPPPKNARLVTLGITKYSYPEVTVPLTSPKGEQTVRDITITDIDPVIVLSLSMSHPFKLINLVNYLSRW